MAAQVNSGTVRVVNGNATVHHLWELLLVSVTGTFANGDAVTWTGGAGTVGAWNAGTATLKVARTSGVNPAVALVITGPSGSGTVNSIAVGSPPNWNTKVTLPAVATFERHYATYDVSSVSADTFVLSVTYLGATAYDIDYGLNTDLTLLGLGLIRPGDVGATAIISRNMTRLTNLLAKGAAQIRLSVDQALSHGSDVTLSWGTEDEDTGGFVGALPVTTFVVPSGIARVNVGVSILLESALANANQVVTVRLLKNASEIAKHSIIKPGVGCTFSVAGLKVTGGDTLSIKVAASDPDTAGLPDVDANVATNFHVITAEVV